MLKRISVGCFALKGLNAKARGEILVVLHIFYPILTGKSHKTPYHSSLFDPPKAVECADLSAL